MLDNKQAFYTYRAYHLKNTLRKETLTPSMEDYLEMIYRLSKETGYTRVHKLASALNVQPPSASSMVQRLAKRNWLDYEKYSIIKLSEQGIRQGAYRLKRHHILEQFLLLFGLDDVFEDTEKMEHSISPAIATGLKLLLRFFESEPAILAKWKSFYREGAQ